MRNDVKKQWEFSFDIRQERLRTVYGRSTYTNAYRDIRNYLFLNGFDNVNEKQGSCYFTSKAMRYSSANKIIRNMFRDLPWLSECIEKTALYERPEHIYNYNTYCERLNKSKKHILALKSYYQKHGLKIPLKVKIDFTLRTKSISDNDKTKENIHVR